MSITITITKEAYRELGTFIKEEKTRLEDHVFDSNFDSIKEEEILEELENLFVIEE